MRQRVIKLLSARYDKYEYSDSAAETVFGELADKIIELFKE